MGFLPWVPPVPLVMLFCRTLIFAATYQQVQPKVGLWGKEDEPGHLVLFILHRTASVQKTNCNNSPARTHIYMHLSPCNFTFELGSIPTISDPFYKTSEKCTAFGKNKKTHGYLMLLQKQESAGAAVLVGPGLQAPAAELLAFPSYSPASALKPASEPRR